MLHIYIWLIFNSLSTKSPNYLSSSAQHILNTQTNQIEKTKTMMLPNPKLSTPSAKFLPSPVVEPPQHSPIIAGGAQNCKLSRRNLSKSSLLLLIGTQTTLTPLLDLSKAQADTISPEIENPTNCRDRVRKCW